MESRRSRDAAPDSAVRSIARTTDAAGAGVRPAEAGRRAALALATAALAGLTGGARAQVTGRSARVGMLYVTDTTPQLIGHFRGRLAALGWSEGRNLEIVASQSGASYEALQAVASVLVAARVDVIVTRGSAATRVARAATTSVPIIAITGDDMIALGFAASLARPGGNLTAISTIVGDLTAKRLNLLHECVSGLARIATLYSPDSPNQIAGLRRLREAAASLGLSVDAQEIRRLSELDGAVASLAERGAAALVPVGSTLLQTEAAQRRLGELALRHRMPGLFVEPDAVRAGGLMRYGVDIAALWLRTAEYVDRILRGAKPGDLPIEEPSRLHLVVNLATARTLGIAIPPTVLARADEVIE